MAYVIECDGIRVEGETERDAKRLLRKAQKEQEAAAALRQDRRDRARVIAQSHGYGIFSRLAEQGTMPRGWELYRPGDKYAPFRPGAADKWDGKVREHTLDTEHGDTVLTHSGNYFYGAVAGMGGQVFAIFFRDPDSACPDIDCYAVGSFEGEVALAPMHGITPDMFRRAGAPYETAPAVAS